MTRFVLPFLNISKILNATIENFEMLVINFQHNSTNTLLPQSQSSNAILPYYYYDAKIRLQSFMFQCIYMPLRLEKESDAATMYSYVVEFRCSAAPTNQESFHSQNVSYILYFLMSCLMILIKNEIRIYIDIKFKILILYIFLSSSKTDK